MTAFQTLETPRTLIRRFTAEDEADFVALLGDRQVTATLAFDEETTTERGAKGLLELIITFYESDNQILAFAIEDKATQAFIGAVGFNSIDEEEADLFYALKPDFWGKGLATEIVGKLSDYALENLPFSTLKVFITPDNEGAKRVVEKNGFESEGLVNHPSFFEAVYLYEKTK